MFDAIKEALAAKDNKPNYRKDILRCVPDNTYTVRLLPNVKDPAKTFFHYFQVGWTSLSTGQYINYISPYTFKERDPVLEDKYRISKTGTEADKEKVKSIIRSERWVAAVYVIDDPVNPENNGTTKLVRFGKQLNRIIDAAISGEDAAEFGEKVFDLSPNGVNLKIKCEKQGDYPTFVSSRFTSPTDLKLSDEKISEIYQSAPDTESLINVKTYEEIKTLYKEHFALETTQSTPKAEVKAEVGVVVDSEIDSLLEGL